MGFVQIVQIIVGLGILNVWLFRRDKATSFRGGATTSMLEEFKYYGLSQNMMMLVGFMKVTLALVVLGGLYLPTLTSIGAAGLGFFMVAAVTMHVKKRDSLVQTLPSVVMLGLCIYLTASSSPSVFSIASRL